MVANIGTPDIFSISAGPVFSANPVFWLPE